MSLRSIIKSIFDRGPRDYTASEFATGNEPRTIAGLSRRTTPTPGNVALCLSGGGSRAMCGGMGQLRALAEIKTANGQSVLSQVKGLSTVSGGSWVGATWTYLPAKTSTADFVGEYVADPGRLVTTKTANHTMAETLDELPAQSAGQTPADRGFSPVGLVLQVLSLAVVFQIPARMIWQTLVGMHVLARQGLFSPELLDHKEPTTFFSLDPETLAGDVTSANPSLAKETAHLIDHPDRPFLICNMAMFVRPLGTGFEQLVPVQSTPRYTGIVGTPEGLDGNSQQVGGGGVASFGFASSFKGRHGQKIAIAQERQWSLTDAIGTSSAFFAEALQNLLVQMRKDPGMLDRMMHESQADADRSISRVAPEHMHATVRDFLGSLERKDLSRIEHLKKVGRILDDIQDLIPAYHYWSPAHARPLDTPARTRFADGGTLENTGVASALAFEDIDSLIACVNSPSPMTAADKGVIGADGLEFPGTAIEIDSQVPPLFGYQPYVKGVGYRLYVGATAPQRPEFRFSQVFPADEFANFLKGMWAATGNEAAPGSNQRPAIMTQTLRVIPNPWFGVRGRGGPGDSNPDPIRVVWSYTTRVRDWNKALSQDGQEILGDFDDPTSYHAFPHYSTFETHLDETQVNLLAHLTAWSLAGTSAADQVRALFQSEAG
jgi:hypothetical protein